MRWRAILVVSVGLNLLLAGGWYSASRYEAKRVTPTADEPSVGTNQVKTLPVYRKQLFSWREVESADYPTYIANLRDIGCPEPTIRDIIIADVNQHYARKKATEVVTPQQQWWRSDADTNVVRAAQQKLQELEDERKALLTRLLGPGWGEVEIASIRPRSSLTLDGPVLGPLPDEVKQSVQEISARSQERIQAYLAQQRREGKEPDPSELARLRQQTREELAGVLSPQQLEEFLLRYSQTAASLRSELGQLQYFNATPEEFRNMFRAIDAIVQQLQLLAGKDDPASAQARQALELQRETALKITLGAERYEQYRLLHDPLYREAVASARQAGDPERAQVFYEISQAVAEERARVNADANLTAEQRAIELKRIELEQLKAQALALGQELPPSEQPETRPRTPVAPTTRPHIVMPGETLATLSVQYLVRITDIIAANPDRDFRTVKEGDVIKIPVIAPPFPTRQ